METEDKANSKPFLNVWRLACIFVIALSGLIYWPSMSGLAIWDDHALIGGSGIGGGKSLAACFTQPFLQHYFRPLVSVSFYVDHRLWGSGPFFYHQTNLLIHVLTTAVCIALFQAAFRSKLAALAGAAAFAVQPAQVSTVAWIGGRTDSLCTLWMALFALTLIRAARSDGSKRTTNIALSSFAFALALLTKEQAIGALPLAPLAFWCFTTPSRRDIREVMRPTVPFVVTAALFVAAWCFFYPNPFKPVLHSFSDQLCLAGRAITYFALLLIAPNLKWMHLLSVGTFERCGPTTVVSGYLILAALCSLQYRLLRRSPEAGWFLAYVLLALLPVCNLAPLPSLVVAPYRAGVAGLGAAALVGWLIAGNARLVNRRGVRDRKYIATFSALRLAGGAAFLLWCGYLTFEGTQFWRDEQTIFTVFGRNDPESIVARYNLTAALLHQHQSAAAAGQLESMLTLLYRSDEWKKCDAAVHALKTRPEIRSRIRENQGNSIAPEEWLATLYAQLGFARMNLRDREGARDAFAIGSAIDRSNDEVNLGMAQLAYDADNFKRAESFLRISLAGQPGRPESHMLMGHALAAQGKWAQARTQLEAWAKIQPWSGQACIEMAQASSRLGAYQDAREQLEYALKYAICDRTEVQARLSDLRGRAARPL